MQPPADFLKEQGQAAKDIATEAGLEQPPIADGQRVAGIYHHSASSPAGAARCSTMTGEFSLVPWKPMIEQRLGQQLAATVRPGRVSWHVKLQRGVSILYKK